MSPFGIIPSSFFNKPWHRCQNGAGEAIPAYACMRITGTTEIDNDIVFQVAKPNTVRQVFYVVNGPLAISNDPAAEGRCTTLAQAGYVLVSGGPVFGQIWGPESDSWLLTSSGSGFLMLGSAQSDPTRAVAVQQFNDSDLVQIFTTASHPMGKLLEQNADGYHAGRVRRWVGGSMATHEDCWIRFTDWHDLDNGATIAEHLRFHQGLRVGTATSGGTTKPLYLAEIGEQTFVAKGPSGGIDKGDSGSCLLYNGDETSSGISKTAKALGFAIPSGTVWVTVQRMRGGSWYVGCWESVAAPSLPAVATSGMGVNPAVMPNAQPQMQPQRFLGL